MRGGSQCSAHSVCVVCGFDSAEKYGVPGMIHAHHAKPLADSAGEHVVDPAIDLAPVCPNRHMLIRSKKDGVMSIEEAKRLAGLTESESRLPYRR